MACMKTVITLAIAALLFLQATGLDVVVASQDCATTCPTDGPDGSCAPLCPDCVCCPTLRSCVEPDCALSSPHTSTMAAEIERASMPLEADPADIFHIPKAALA